MEEEDYLQVIAESEGRQGYLYEPVYTDEEEAVAAAAATAGGRWARIGTTCWTHFLVLVYKMHSNGDGRRDVLLPRVPPCPIHY